MTDASERPMLADWASLWARDPGLRPTRDAGAFRLGTIAGDYTNYPFGWERSGQIDDVDEMDPETFAALCRDAAVRWLADQRLYVTPPCKYSSSPTSWWALWETRVHPHMVASLVNMHDGVILSEPPRTLDAALFAACAAVLDARDASTKTAAAAESPTPESPL